MGIKDPEIKYRYSPYQEQALQRGHPVLQQLSAAAQAGQPAYDIPDLPQMYQVPNANILQPTGQWWNSMSPQVMQGLWKPYQEGGMALSENLAARGQYGSPKHGVSGAAAGELGEYAANAASNVGRQAFQMSYPGMSTYYNALLGQGQNQFASGMEAWGQQIAANRMPYDVTMGNYGQAVNQYTGVVHPSTAHMLLRGFATSIPMSMQGMQEGKGKYGKIASAIGGGLQGWSAGMYG